jgi:hypothetical protein
MVELNVVPHLATTFAPFRKRRGSGALQNASEARHRWFLPGKQSRNAAWTSQNDIVKGGKKMGVKNAI